MLAPASVENLNSALLNQLSNFSLNLFVLVAPPHHQVGNAVNSERSVVVLSDRLRNRIINSMDPFPPILVNGPCPSEVVVRVWNHVDYKIAINHA